MPDSDQRPPLSSRHRQQPPRTVAEARLAFTARLLAPVNSCGERATGGAALEDGEIRERATRVDEAAEREQCIFAGVNLALLEALGQNGAAALAAIDKSLTAAEGNSFSELNPFPLIKFMLEFRWNAFCLK